MKQSGKVAMYLAGGLVLSASALAVTAEPQGNPYQGIVERNVFALKPPPDPESLKPQAPPPPPIALQGIISMFGRQQVLFKVQMPPSPPKPAETVAMVLSVGQREGDVEVLAIDEKAGTITFNNHGTIETKNLTNDAPKLAAGMPATPFPTMGQSPGMLPRAGLNSTPNGAGASAGSTLKNVPNIPSRTLRLPATPSASVPAPGAAVGGISYQMRGGSGVPVMPVTAPTPAAVQTPPAAQPPGLSAEAQAAIMLLQQANDPSLPPTPVPHDLQAPPPAP